MNMTGFIRLKLLSIDAWRDDGSWQWNSWFRLAEFDFAEHELTPRKILAKLREHAWLLEGSKGILRVEFAADDGDDGTLIEIQLKDSREPVLALSNLHGG